MIKIRTEPILSGQNFDTKLSFNIFIFHKKGSLYKISRKIYCPTQTKAKH